MKVTFPSVNPNMTAPAIQVVPNIQYYLMLFILVHHISKLNFRIIVDTIQCDM
jgi:hypothetical protein